MWVTWWNVSPREDGFPEGGARGKTILPRGDIPSCYPHWHGIFVLLYWTNPVCNCKQSKVTDDWWFTHSPLGVARGNGQHEALTDGIRQHDDCSLLSQPITSYDLKVRYNKTYYGMDAHTGRRAVCMNQLFKLCTTNGMNFYQYISNILFKYKLTDYSKLFGPTQPLLYRPLFLCTYMYCWWLQKSNIWSMYNPSICPPNNQDMQLGFEEFH